MLVNAAARHPDTPLLWVWGQLKIIVITDSIFYTKYEAKDILEKSCSILSFICQHKTEVTRLIIQKFDDFKPSLRYYIEKYRTEDSRNLYEAVESEEECMKDSSRRAEATVLIQATFRMYRQRCRWRKIKSGMIALQRLTRYNLDISDPPDSSPRW